MTHSTMKLSNLIKAFGAQIEKGGPRKAEEITSIEEMYSVILPSDYRQFLGNYGYLTSDQFTILGLSEKESTMPSVAAVTMMLRFYHMDMPLEIIPIEALDETHYACIACSNTRSQNAPIVLLDIDAPQPVEKLIQLASSFEAYLINRLIALLPQDEETDASAQNSETFERAWKQFEYRVHEYQKEYDYDHAKGGKLPRNHEWRPYRYCIQDVVFGVTVVQHYREANCLQVDVFLTSEVPEYGPLAGSIALTSFLLSEAYRCGGTMEIRFTKNVENGQVPQELQELAHQYEIVFSQASAGKVLPGEAKALYAALTDFPPSLQQKINELEQIGRMKMARACYVVNHGVWSKEQVEMIVLGSEQPDSVLSGRAQPHQRHLYFHDLLQARAALLGGMLDRILAQRQRVSDSGVAYDMEDDVRPLEISFDGELYAKQYHSDEAVPLPWLYPDGQTREIAGGMPFNVLVRARDAADLQLHLAGDLKQATDYRQQTQRPTLLLIPNDFMILPDAFREKIHQQAQTAQIGLMVCPDPVLTFDTEAAQKLVRSRILRQ